MARREFDEPMDPPADIEQNSKRPSHAGQSSPVRTVERTTTQKRKSDQQTKEESGRRGEVCFESERRRRSRDSTRTLRSLPRGSKPTLLGDHEIRESRERPTSRSTARQSLNRFRSDPLEEVDVFVRVEPRHLVRRSSDRSLDIHDKSNE